MTVHNNRAFKAIRLSWILSLVSLLLLSVLSYIDPSISASRFRYLAIVLFLLVLIVYWIGNIFYKDD